MSDAEFAAVVGYLAGLPGSAAGAAPADIVYNYDRTAVPALTETEFADAKQIFFQRCAGCHGALRKGATGPALTPDKTGPKGTAALAAIIFNGTPAACPTGANRACSSPARPR